MRRAAERESWRCGRIAVSPAEGSLGCCRKELQGFPHSCHDNIITVVNNFEINFECLIVETQINKNLRLKMNEVAIVTKGLFQNDVHPFVIILDIYIFPFTKH